MKTLGKNFKKLFGNTKIHRNEIVCVGILQRYKEVVYDIINNVKNPIVDVCYRTWLCILISFHYDMMTNSPIDMGDHYSSHPISFDKSS